MNKNKLILVIEDEYDIRSDLKETLQLNNYEVITAENGFDGFEKIVKYNPDLIICDVVMPIMNGYELLTLIRKNERIANIPFLFLTAKSDYDEIREGMNLGADDYLLKPFNHKILINAIVSRLEKSNLQKSIYENKIENIKNSIFRSIPHEIRTPLNGILNNSNWIINNIQQLSLDEIKKGISLINCDANRLNRLFENYIFYIKLKNLIQDDSELQEVMESFTHLPNSIVNDICNFIFSDKSNQFVVSVKNDINKLKINEHHFNKIIYELLDNAKKFSDINSKIIIKTQSDNNKFIFEVENYGVEFPKDKIELISELTQFNRSSNEQSGLGLGLGLCIMILNIYNSKLSITSEDNKTIVSFSLDIS
jgi:DNA-binding response OmpR family regulator